MAGERGFEVVEPEIRQIWQIFIGIKKVLLLRGISLDGEYIFVDSVPPKTGFLSLTFLVYGSENLSYLNSSALNLPFLPGTQVRST